MNKLSLLTKHIYELTDQNDHTGSVLLLAAYMNQNYSDKKDIIEPIIENLKKYIKEQNTLHYITDYNIESRTYDLNTLLEIVASKENYPDYIKIRSAF